MDNLLTNITDEEKEYEVMMKMEEKFVPELREMLREGNERLFRMYNENFCRQAAYFGLDLLREELPEYVWSAWEGKFRDKIYGMTGEYEHAWIYGRSRKRDEEDLLVDLGRNQRPRIFMKVDNEADFPFKLTGYENMELLHHHKVNMTEQKQERELFTGMKYKTFLRALRKRM